MWPARRPSGGWGAWAALPPGLSWKCCSQRAGHKPLRAPASSRWWSAPGGAWRAHTLMLRVNFSGTAKLFSSIIFFLSHLDRGARRRDGGSFLAHGDVPGGQKPAQRGLCPPDGPPLVTLPASWKLTQPGAISEAGVFFPSVQGFTTWRHGGCGPLHLLDTQAWENWRECVPQFPHL